MEKPFNNAEGEAELDRFYSKDPYEVLGVSRSTSIEDIQIARKELMKRFHPDNNQDSRSLEISKNINNAFDVIKKHRKLHQDDFKKPDHQDRHQGFRETDRSRSTSEEERRDNIFDYFSKYWQRGFLENETYYKEIIKDLTRSDVEAFFKTEKGKEAYTRYLESFIDLKSFNAKDLHEHMEDSPFIRRSSEIIHIPEVSERLKKRLKKKMQEYSENYDNKDALLNMIEGWTYFGIDLSKDFFQREDIIKILEGRVRSAADEALKSFKTFGLQPSKEILDFLSKV